MLGGDGAFLMAASKVLNPSKPIVGFNTDPSRSEGYLCLPKSLAYEAAINNFMSGRFRWLLRKRLRITVVGDKKHIMHPPMELHRQQLLYPEYRYVDLVNEPNCQGNDQHPLLVEDSNGRNGFSDEVDLGKRVLPVLALNEVFVGESLSSRVSYLEVKLDGEPYEKTRNSGLCVSTGELINSPVQANRKLNGFFLQEREAPPGLSISTSLLTRTWSRS